MHDNLFNWVKKKSINFPGSRKHTIIDRSALDKWVLGTYSYILLLLSLLFALENYFESGLPVIIIYLPAVVYSNNISIGTYKHDVKVVIVPTS